MQTEEETFIYTMYELNKNVRRVSEYLKPVVDTASQITWKPINGFMPLIRRAILCRQYDFLDTISFLVENERGYASVSFLRASCEELIWLKYLHQINSLDAEEVITNILQAEIFNNLEAQDEYGGRNSITTLNLLPYLEGAIKTRPSNKIKIKTLGRKLEWDKRTIDNANTPSIAFLARKTGQLSLYKFLYHASSRYVHFSGMELLRRAWGKSGEISIKSNHFNDYWSAFSLIWGLRLFILTYLELNEHLVNDGIPDYEIDEEFLLDTFRLIADFGEMPIITESELRPGII